MTEGSELEQGTLAVTPTWAFALVCGAFVLASVIVERLIHRVGKRVKKRQDLKYLNESLEKIKEELMLLGFISLLLTLVQPEIAKICLPHSTLRHFLPCKFNSTQLHLMHTKPSAPESSPCVAHRRLMFLGSQSRRILADGEITPSKCYSEGKVPLISAEGAHQIHIFIFVLAVGHVILTCMTLLLARFEVRSWRVWEEKAQAPSGISQENTFLHKHANSSWRIWGWIKSFFIQFGSTVTYTEYHTLRNSFIQNHKFINTFDFHKYMLRALEFDFKGVVGISAGLWVYVVIYLVLNVYGWYTYFWLGFIPLAVLLMIGAKLHRIVKKLAIDIAQAREAGGVVTLSDDVFWFKRPKLILLFFHFILFLNAFEVCFFVWVWTQFGFKTCFRNKRGFVIARLANGLFMLFLFSYRTLPLYALVSQMGATLKLDETVANTFKDLFKAKKKPSSTHG